MVTHTEPEGMHRDAQFGTQGPAKVPLSACWVWQQPNAYILFPIPNRSIGFYLVFFGSSGKGKNLAYFL